MKNIKLPIILLALALSVFLIFNMQKNQQQKVCINSECFNVEIAKTFLEKANGLMNRTHLDKKAGMLFIFSSEGFHSFWMKNTLIPLDIIWISKDKKIVYIEHNVQPCKSFFCPSYAPKEKALYVLEINAGLSKQYNFKDGDDVVFDIK